MAGEGLLSALEAALRALDRVGLGCALVGGAALPAWGRIRATQDVDLLVGLSWSSEPGQRTIASLVSRLREEGFAHLERADRRRLCAVRPDKSALRRQSAFTGSHLLGVRFRSNVPPGTAPRPWRATLCEASLAPPGREGCCLGFPLAMGVPVFREAPARLATRLEALPIPGGGSCSAR